MKLSLIALACLLPDLVLRAGALEIASFSGDGIIVTVCTLQACSVAALHH